MPEYEWLLERLELTEDSTDEQIVDELQVALAAANDRVRYETPGLGLEVTSHSVLSLGNRHYALFLLRKS